MLEYAVVLIFPAVMAFAAAMDLLTMTIPNRLTLALAAAFFVAAPVMGLPFADMALHVGAGLLVLAAGITLFAIGGFGGGDAKLLAAGALWIGFDGLLPYLVYVTIFGGVLALVVLAYRRVPATALPIPHWAARLHTASSGIPYGIAIASSALLIYPHTPLFAVAA
ncbi:MAG: prepilin peptidase [Hyphomicrobium sp.]|uniref:A24 family peptidase n=1 Tax=Hyphomicrobium sp. TaxID=82 RepID=UPI003D0D5B63